MALLNNLGSTTPLEMSVLAHALAEAGIAWRGSQGSSSPRMRAVWGMNCATPWAPAGLTAAMSKRLSFQISRAKNAGGME